MKAINPDILLDFFYQPLNPSSMKRILLSLLLGMMVALLSSSSVQFPKTETANASLASTENTDMALYESIIQANIAAISGPETGLDNPTMEYKNARNQYCREPAGKMGCVRAVGKKCNLGVYCILPKDNL